MPKRALLSIDWSKHSRCRQCDELFGDGRPRAAAIIDLKVAGVFHGHCWPAFEAIAGRKVQAIVPFPGDLTR